MSHRLAAAPIAIVIATALISLAEQVRADSPAGGASVRVIARMASADRIEFGLRVDGRTELPQLRFVSRSVEDHRWLRSSAIELGDGRSVQVLARRLADGRFETALRIVGVDGILQPRLRFIAAGLTHNRWLRSSEIIIPAADAEPGETVAGREVLTTGSDHSCAVTADGSLECWGSNEFGQSDPPAGQYSEVSAGSTHTCALNVAGEVRCWGAPGDARTAASARSLHVDRRRLRPHLRGLRVGRDRVLGLERGWPGHSSVGQLHGGQRRPLAQLRARRRGGADLLGRQRLGTVGSAGG